MTWLIFLNSLSWRVRVVAYVLVALFAFGASVVYHLVKIALSTCGG